MITISIGDIHDVTPATVYERILETVVYRPVIDGELHDIDLFGREYLDVGIIVTDPIEHFPMIYLIYLNGVLTGILPWSWSYIRTSSSSMHSDKLLPKIYDRLPAMGSGAKEALEACKAILELQE